VTLNCIAGCKEGNPTVIGKLLVEYCQVRSCDCYYSEARLPDEETFRDIADEAFEAATEVPVIFVVPDLLTPYLDSWLAELDEFPVECRIFKWLQVNSQGNENASEFLRSLDKFAFPHIALCPPAGVTAYERRQFTKLLRDRGVPAISYWFDERSTDLYSQLDEVESNCVLTKKRRHDLIAPLFAEIDRVETALGCFGCNLEAFQYREALRGNDNLRQLGKLYAATARPLSPQSVMRKCYD